MKELYELLRADFDTTLAKSSSERNEAMVTTLAKLDIKLDQLSGRIDDVKLSLSIDLDEIRGEIGADRAAATPPSSP